MERRQGTEVCEKEKDILKSRIEETLGEEKGERAACESLLWD